MSLRDEENGPRDLKHPADTAVRDIVRAVLTSEATHELPYFSRLARFDDSWVVWRLGRDRGRDEPLGFGIGEIAPLVTPVIWIVVNEAAREFGSAAGGGMLAGLRALLRKILRRKPKAATVPPLTKAQLDQVYDTAKAELLKAGLSQRRAEAVTDRLYRVLSEGFDPDGEAGTGPATSGPTPTGN